jgi:hypothetical protein
VQDELGSPIHGARIVLVPVDQRLRERWYSLPRGRTDVWGQYSLTGVEPGEYLVSIHRHSAPTASVPYIGLYYPRADEESSADQIRVTALETTELLPVTLRRTTLATIIVNVRFDDGARPAWSNLLFHNPQFPREAVIGDSAPGITGGRGTIEVPVGFTYLARAKVSCDMGDVIDSRESRPIQRVAISDPATDLELTFVIPGGECRLWTPP